MGRWQAKLEKKQAFLGRIVDIGAELFAISSAATYAHDDQGASSPDLRRGRVRARRPVLQAGPRAASTGSSTSCGPTTTTPTTRRAKDVLEGRFQWIEEGVADPSGDGPMIAGQPEAPAEVPVAAGH